MDFSPRRGMVRLLVLIGCLSCLFVCLYSRVVYPCVFLGGGAMLKRCESE